MSATLRRGDAMAAARATETGVLSVPLVRQGPRPGEIGHVGTCPLCANAAGCPPCLACRDELRARLREMAPRTTLSAGAWN